MDNEIESKSLLETNCSSDEESDNERNNNGKSNKCINDQTDILKEVKVDKQLSNSLIRIETGKEHVDKQSNKSENSESKDLKNENMIQFDNEDGQLTKSVNKSKNDFLTIDLVDVDNEPNRNFKRVSTDMELMNGISSSFKDDEMLNRLNISNISDILNISNSSNQNKTADTDEVLTDNSDEIEIFNKQQFTKNNSGHNRTI